MYPTAIIVLLETQRSMVDICEIGTPIATNLAVSEARPATVGHLSFAVEPVHSTADNEAESQLSHTLRSQGEEGHGLEEVILEVKESQVGASR